MEYNEESRKHTILNAREQKQQLIDAATVQRERSIAIQKEQLNLKRQLRQDTVNRIMRINEYKKSKILEKIE